MDIVAELLNARRKIYSPSDLTCRAGDVTPDLVLVSCDGDLSSLAVRALASGKFARVEPMVCK